MPKDTDTLVWYENAVKNFLKKALASFSETDNLNTFFLVELKDALVFDIDQYEGLCKVGSKEIKPAAYLEHFKIESPENSDDIETQVDHAYSLFLNKTRSLRRKESVQD